MTWSFDTVCPFIDSAIYDMGGENQWSCVWNCWTKSLNYHNGSLENLLICENRDFRTRWQIDLPEQFIHAKSICLCLISTRIMLIRRQSWSSSSSETLLINYILTSRNPSPKQCLPGPFILTRKAWTVWIEEECNIDTEAVVFGCNFSHHPK